MANAPETTNVDTGYRRDKELALGAEPATGTGFPTCDQTERVVRHFGTISDQWHIRYERAPERMSDLDLQLRLQNACGLIDEVTASRTTVQRVLDLGCGAGTITRTLLTSRFEVIGVDRVPKMIATASLANPGRSFFVADAQQLPLATEVFDIVVSLGVFEYLRHLPSALSEVRRVLAPNGHLILSIPNRECWFRRCSSGWRKAFGTLKRLAPRLSQTADFISNPRPYDHSEWSLPSMRSMLANAGFNCLDVRFNTYGPWGRLGRTDAAMDFSRWMTRNLSKEETLSRRLAWTAVLLVQKK